MNSFKASFSNLTNDQIDEVKALETKFNNSHSKGQETVLIAYVKES